MRPTWDEYFLGLARQAAKMSTCLRASVGAVVVKDRRVIATGYNGAPRGLAHCSEEGCLVEGGHCRRVVHAEANALLFAGAERAKGATLYCTHLPCRACAGLIVNAQIARVVYDGEYGASPSVALLEKAGIVIEKGAGSGNCITSHHP